MCLTEDGPKLYGYAQQIIELVEEVSGKSIPTLLTCVISTKGPSRQVRRSLLKSTNGNFRRGQNGGNPLATGTLHVKK